MLAFDHAWYATPEHSGRWARSEQVQPDRHAIGTTTHYPTQGAYDGADPVVIDHHMRQMAEANIDGPIVSWWGPGRRFESDRCMSGILEAAQRHHRVVSAYLEAVTAGISVESRVSRAVEETVFLVQQYGKHPAWLKVDGRPVIFVYGRAIGELQPVERWRAVREQVQKQTGVNPYLVGDEISLDAAEVFDAIHTYNTAGMLAGKSIDEMKRRRSGSSGSPPRSPTIRASSPAPR